MLWVVVIALIVYFVVKNVKKDRTQNLVQGPVRQAPTKRLQQIEDLGDGDLAYDVMYAINELSEELWLFKDYHYLRTNELGVIDFHLKKIFDFVEDFNDSVAPHQRYDVSNGFIDMMADAEDNTTLSADWIHPAIGLLRREMEAFVSHLKKHGIR